MEIAYTIVLVFRDIILSPRGLVFLLNEFQPEQKILIGSIQPTRKRLARVLKQFKYYKSIYSNLGRN